MELDALRPRIEGPRDDDVGTPIALGDRCNVKLRVRVRLEHRRVSSSIGLAGVRAVVGGRVGIVGRSIGIIGISLGSRRQSRSRGSIGLFHEGADSRASLVAGRSRNIGGGERRSSSNAGRLDVGDRIDKGVVDPNHLMKLRDVLSKVPAIFVGVTLIPERETVLEGGPSVIASNQTPCLDCGNIELVISKGAIPVVGHLGIGSEVIGGDVLVDAIVMQVSEFIGVIARVLLDAVGFIVVGQLPLTTNGSFDEHDPLVLLEGHLRVALRIAPDLGTKGKNAKLQLVCFPNAVCTLNRLGEVRVLKRAKLTDACSKSIDSECSEVVGEEGVSKTVVVPSRRGSRLYRSRAG